MPKPIRRDFAIFGKIYWQAKDPFGVWTLSAAVSHKFALSSDSFLKGKNVTAKCPRIPLGLDSNFTENSKVDRDFSQLIL